MFLHVGLSASRIIVSCSDRLLTSGSEDDLEQLVVLMTCVRCFGSRKRAVSMIAMGECHRDTWVQIYSKMFLKRCSYPATSLKWQSLVVSCLLCRTQPKPGIPVEPQSWMLFLTMLTFEILDSKSLRFLRIGVDLNLMPFGEC